MRARLWWPFVLLDCFDKAGANDPGWKRKETHADKSGYAGEETSEYRDWVDITIADCGQRGNGPPHGRRNGRERLGLNWILDVIEHAGRDQQQAQG